MLHFLLTSKPDIWTPRKMFSGHRDAKFKTGDNPGFPGRMATLYYSIVVNG
jgi:hypothetical protein